MRLHRILRRTGEYVRWARELSALAPTAGARLWLLLASLLLLVKPHVPVARDWIWSVPLTLGDRPVRFSFRDRSELRAIAEVFLGDEYAVPHDGDVRSIVDLGANAGQASLFFRDRFPGAQVLSVEPDPLNYELLRRNVGADPAVTTLNCAVTAAPGPVAVHRESLSWASTVAAVPEGGGATVVEGRTLDQLFEDAGGRIDLLKIDIEGLEHEVLMASDRLRAVKVVIGELHYRLLELDADEAVAMWKQHGGFTSAARIRPHLFLLSRS